MLGEKVFHVPRLQSRRGVEKVEDLRRRLDPVLRRHFGVDEAVVLASHEVCNTLVHVSEFENYVAYSLAVYPSRLLYAITFLWELGPVHVAVAHHRFAVTWLTLYLSLR